MPHGEFEIIERYFSGFISHRGEQVILGPGDDCAILKVPADRQLCISTDTLNAGIHFPVGAPASAVAQRSLCANLSDLAAMGSTPFAFTLSMTLPEEDEAWLEEFSATLADLVGEYDIPLVGGNLARGALSITITVLGTLPIGKGLRRQGAGIGDDVYVTGTLGDAAGGLAMVNRGESTGGRLQERYYHPRPRLDFGVRLLDIASATIDISDGLAADLGHICEASSVGARVDVDAIPLSKSLRDNFQAEQALNFAVGAGDDYELCFTAPPELRQKIEAIAKEEGLPVTRIGEIVAGDSPVFTDAGGNPREFPEHGYQHFHEA